MTSIDLAGYDQSNYSRGRSALTVIVWDLVQTWLIRTSPHPCYGWRRFWYRMFGARIGRGVLIRNSVVCNYPWRLTIGNRSWIGDQVTLYCLGDVTIGDNVVVSQQAYLCTGTHDHADPHFALIVKPIQVQAGAWIALGALILPGITIGEGALIAARSVLTRDAEAWTIYQGVPARACGKRLIATRDVSV